MCNKNIFYFFIEIWNNEEDERLKRLVLDNGTGNCKSNFLFDDELLSINFIYLFIGSIISDSLPGRTGKQCRERWHNHLNEGIIKGDWTEEEDKVITTMRLAIGNQWSKVRCFYYYNNNICSI